MNISNEINRMQILLKKHKGVRGIYIGLHYIKNKDFKTLKNRKHKTLKNRTYKTLKNRKKNFRGKKQSESDLLNKRGW
jgi:hypothetical protein